MALRRWPSSSSTIGGFHRTNSFSPRGDASSVTASNGSPTSRSASSTGLPMVAEERANRGRPP
jgi:hypothetical protein